jgi:hypothetical protein
MIYSEAISVRGVSRPVRVVDGEDDVLMHERASVAPSARSR